MSLDINAILNTYYEIELPYKNVMTFQEHSLPSLVLIFPNRPRWIVLSFGIRDLEIGLWRLNLVSLNQARQ
jgi:hypothetical protein